jgi:hypothetical protein
VLLVFLAKQADSFDQFVFGNGGFQLLDVRDIVIFVAQFYQPAQFSLGLYSGLDLLLVNMFAFSKPKTLHFAGLR